jgi:hypothetical protein
MSETVPLRRDKNNYTGRSAAGINGGSQIKIVERKICQYV